MTSYFAAHAKRILGTPGLYESPLKTGAIHHAIGLLENDLFGQNVHLTEQPDGCPAVKEQIRQWNSGGYRKFDVREQLDEFLNS
jgi:hypothetical protein